MAIARHLTLTLPVGASPALLKDLPLHSLVIELRDQTEALLKYCCHFQELHTLEVMSSDLRKESRLSCEHFLHLTKLPALGTLRLPMLGVSGLSHAQFSLPTLRVRR